MIKRNTPSKKTPNKTALATEMQEFSDYIKSYFNRNKTAQQAWEMFDADQAKILADVEGLQGLLVGHCHYVAVALFGKLKFKDSPEVDLLADDYTAVTMPQLQAAHCIAVAPSARPILTALLDKPELLKILALCVMAERSKTLGLPARPKA
jgi:hypothetical protein